MEFPAGGPGIIGFGPGGITVRGPGIIEFELAGGPGIIIEGAFIFPTGCDMP